MKGDSDIMKKQVFCMLTSVHGAFKPEKIHIAREAPISDFFRNKPFGGIWTSTLNNNTCGWLDWCRVNWPERGGDTAVIFTPKANVKVYQIKDLETMKAASTRIVPGAGYFGGDLTMIDFKRLIDEGYDGVNATKEAAKAFHYSLGNNIEFTDLNCWDEESTVWFHRDWFQSYEFKRIKDNFIVP